MFEKKENPSIGFLEICRSLKSTICTLPTKKGFTIIEVIVGIAIFAILASATLGMSALLSRNVRVAREKTVLASLASTNLEIVRNMPYSQVGTMVGNPRGILPDLPNAVTQTIGGNRYQIYYRVAYIQDPAETATGTPDYKQVKMNIVNTTTNQVTSFFTTVVPKGIITNPNTGALQVTVINSQGQPVQGANVEILYPTTAPYTFDLHDGADSSGKITEIGLPPGVNAYRIIATKSGYSTDQTYPITAQNLNPVHPDATIVNGQITQVTLSIDLLATLNIKTLNNVCQPISNVNVNVQGSKLIGNGPPPVYKYNNSFSSVSGVIALNNIEWDTYTPTLLNGQNYIVYGTSPIQKITVGAGTTQTYTMILGQNSTANSLLVIVKDAASGTALEGATVTLIKGGSVPQTYDAVTGGSVWVQNDWTGGSGQAQWSSSTPTGYFQDSTTIDVNSAPTGVRLQKTSGRYLSSGWMESSTFDTGTNSSNYTILSWQPTSQTASTTLQFQVAANNDNATWNYVGPDGTSGTYFTTSGSDMGSSFDGNRYVRFKAYLSTADDKYTPVLTSVNLNYVAGCFTPGQVIFSELTAGNNYTLTVSLPGYSTQTLNVTISGNLTFEFDLSP
jgi:prepilin-type N-terminal cleavage/methylation domain-containing protein